MASNRMVRLFGENDSGSASYTSRANLRYCWADMPSHF